MPRWAGRVAAAAHGIARVALALVAACGWSRRCAPTARPDRPARTTAVGMTRMFADSEQRETPGTGDLRSAGRAFTMTFAYTTSGIRLPDNSLPLESPEIDSRWRKPDLRTGEREPRRRVSNRGYGHLVCAICTTSRRRAASIDGPIRVWRPTARANQGRPNAPGAEPVRPEGSDAARGPQCPPGFKPGRLVESRGQRRPGRGRAVGTSRPGVRVMARPVALQTCVLPTVETAPAPMRLASLEPHRGGCTMPQRSHREVRKCPN